MDEFLDNDWLARLAREEGFILRERLISAQEFVSLLVMESRGQKELSLLDLVGKFFDLTGKKVSQTAIHNRFSPAAVRFMSALLGRLGKAGVGGIPRSGSMGEHFSAFLVKDSTKVALPAKYRGDYPGYRQGAAMMSVQLEMDLLGGFWKSLYATGARDNDQADSKKTLCDIPPGSLNIRDLGYVTLAYLLGVGKKGAFFLNRLSKASVYHPDGEPVDWGKVAKQADKAGGKPIELDVLVGAKDRLPCRMVLEPAGEEVAKKRVKKAKRGGKRKKGYKISKEYRHRAAFNIIITNVGRGVLAAEQVLQAYRLRWQIEMVFKSWKSNLSIDQAKEVKTPRMECQMYARLIAARLFEMVYDEANRFVSIQLPDKICSRAKIFNWLGERAREFGRAATSPGSLAKWLRERLAPMLKEMLLEHKKHRENHYEVFLGIINSLS